MGAAAWAAELAAEVRAQFARHQEAGLIVDGEHPSPEFVALARAIVDLQVESAAELWAGNGTLVERLVELTAAAIRSADERRTGPLPAFDQQRRTAEPPSPPGRLLRRITVLRYLRSDAHAAVAEDEEATNEVMAMLLGALSDDERAELLGGCQRLPGDDPRRATGS